MKRKFLFFLILISLFGCATAKPPVLNLSEKSTIGIINLVDHEATHTHIGTTVFNNFEKKYPVSWNFPETIESELIKELKQSTRYNIINIPPSEELIQNESAILDMTWSLKINPEIIPTIGKLMQENYVDVLLIIRDHEGEDYFAGTGKMLKSYGIYTRSFLGIKSAYAYAYANIIGFHSNPPQYIGMGCLNEHPQIDNFEFPSNIKEMDADRLNSIAALITKKYPNLHQILSRELV